MKNLVNQKRGIVSLILIFTGFVLMAQNSEEKEYIARCQETVAYFLETDKGMQNFFSNSYGFAVFPAVGKGAVGVGGAHGNGILYKGGQPYGTTSMSQVSIGFQLGGQSYMEVVFLEDSKAYYNYLEGKVKMAAQASAVAATAGASADVAYSDGVAIFTAVNGGLMYEASVGGQKFKYKDFKD